MFFQECERFADERPELRDIIVKIDELLSSCGHSSLFSPDEIASYLGEKVSQVSGVFDGLSKTGLLIEEKYIECPECGNLISIKDYERTVGEKDVFECTQCQSDLSDRTLTETIRYRLNPAVKIKSISLLKPSAGKGASNIIQSIQRYVKGKGLTWGNIIFQINRDKFDSIQFRDATDRGAPVIAKKAISYEDLGLHKTPKGRAKKIAPTVSWLTLRELIRIHFTKARKENVGYSDYPNLTFSVEELCAELFTGDKHKKRMSETSSKYQERLKGLLEKRLSDLGKRLNKIFGITDDPFPSGKEGYHIKFLSQVFIPHQTTSEKSRALGSSEEWVNTEEDIGDE